MIIFSKLSYTKITLGYGNRLDYATAFTSRLPPPSHFPAEASCSLGRTSKRVRIKSTNLRNEITSQL